MGDTEPTGDAANEVLDDDIIAHIVGGLDEQKRKNIEEKAASDRELAAQIFVLRTLLEASLQGDTGTIVGVADALGALPDDFLPDEYETVAAATFHLLKGTVLKEEARAYALYRKEADQLDAHETQTDYLDERALNAVVQAGVFPDVKQAETAVLKVLTHLGPVLRKIADEEKKPPSE